MLDVFALIVIVVLLSVGIGVVVTFGSLPGNIARQRKHPQADAINVLGWIGIATLGVPWLLALVWAYARPSPAPDSSFEDRLSTVEAKLADAGARAQ